MNRLSWTHILLIACAMSPAHVLAQDDKAALQKVEEAQRRAEQADLSKERHEEIDRLKLEMQALAKALQASEQARFDLQKKVKGLIDNLEEAARRIHELNLNTARILAENERLKLENRALAKTLRASDNARLDSQKLVNDLYKQREDAIKDRDRLQLRNENLLELIRQEQLRKGSAPKDRNLDGQLELPKAPYPPDKKVKGVIEKIDRRQDEKSVLLQVSVGINHGVNKNNTLEVYRTDPRPEYLGTIRIIESYPSKSVGRLMRSASPNPLREGDIVVDSIIAPDADNKK